MNFSSLTFLLYFLPISLLIYIMLGFSIKLQNLWLLLVSFAFYAWGEPKYFVLFLVSIVINFVFGLVIDRYNINDADKKKAKAFLILGIMFNLLILGTFKYLDLIISQVNTLSHHNFGTVFNFVIPIGISFCTLRNISYLVDVYRNDGTVQHNPVNFGLYIAFFPQIFAGPIIKYKDVEEFLKNRNFKNSNLAEGTWRFSIGLIKKVLIADHISIIVDNIYRLTQTGRGLYSVSSTMAWIGAISFILQVYYDFSGYSDMAIGLGKMFGFDFKENFNYPLVAKSFNDFWKRWYISLGEWFKDYVFIPLCGDKPKNADVIVKSIFTTWFLIGLWHGESFTFIAWALFNAILIVIEKVVNFEEWKISKFIKIIYVDILCILLGVIYRSSSLTTAREYFLNMFLANKNPFISNTPIMIIKEYYMFFIPAFIFATPVASIIKDKVEKTDSVIAIILYKVFSMILLMLGMVLVISTLTRGKVNPFIFARLG